MLPGVAGHHSEPTGTTPPEPPVESWTRIIGVDLSPNGTFQTEHEAFDCIHTVANQYAWYGRPTKSSGLTVQCRSVVQTVTAGPSALGDVRFDNYFFRENNRTGGWSGNYVQLPPSKEYLIDFVLGVQTQDDINMRVFDGQENAVRRYHPLGDYMVSATSTAAAFRSLQNIEYTDVATFLAEPVETRGAVLQVRPHGAQAQEGLQLRYGDDNGPPASMAYILIWERDAPTDTSSDPYGDTFEGRIRWVGQRYATGPQGTWQWGEHGGTGWVSGIMQDANGRVGISTKNDNYNTTVYSPNLGSTSHWVEVQVAVMPTQTINFGPATNIDDQKIANQVRANCMRVNPDGTFEWFNVDANDWTRIATQGIIDNARIQAGDTVGIEYRDGGGDFIRMWINRPMTGDPESHNGFAQTDNNNASCCGFASERNSDTANSGYFTNFLCGAGTYPYR